MYAITVLVSLLVLIVFLVWGKVERQWVSLAIALILVILGAVSFKEFIGYVDWDVLGLILGMSILTVYLERCGFAELAADYIVRFSRGSVYLLVFSISLIAGLISTFMENVSVVILFFPIVYAISRSLGIDPVIPTIMLTLSANIAGSATMIGDPPAIITAGAFNLSFLDFIVYKGKPSMLVFTLISMVVAIAITSTISSRRLSIISAPGDMSSNLRKLDLDKVFLLEVLAFLFTKILLLSIRHILYIPLSLTAAIAVAGITIARAMHRDKENIVYAFRHGFEWKLLLFLVGVFVLSGAFEKHGIAKLFAEKLIEMFGNSVVALTSSLLYLSVVLSSVIDNIPITLTMIPVVKRISETLLIDPVVVMWSILIGITLGGNLTYIGASANVTAVRLLEKRGYNITFLDFIKISIVYNTVSVVLAWILYTLFYFTL